MDILTAAAHKQTLNSVIYVMRHGQTVLDQEERSDGWLDYPLSDKGRVGLMPAQQFLKLAPVKHIYTNTLARCIETAKIIQSGILSHPDLKEDDNLRTWNLGELIGGKKKPNKPIVQFYMAHPDLTPAAGESMNKFRKRFLGAIRTYIRNIKKDGPCLVVASGSNVREISRMLTGNTETLDLDEGGVLMIVSHKGKLHGKVVLGGKHGETDWDS